MALSDSAFITLPTDDHTLFLKGNWSFTTVNQLEKVVAYITSHQLEFTVIDASGVEELDTAGAFFINLLQSAHLKMKRNVVINGLSDKFNSILTLVSEEQTLIDKKKIPVARSNGFEKLGRWAVDVIHQMMLYFYFLGELTITFLKSIWNPFIRIQWSSVINEIDRNGFKALNIIAIMMFLIGVVLAYQMGTQLRIYGANIYVVDVSGIALLREFSPLITSVIIAGRTSTAYAALIGTMKVNEEVDALQTMGFSPINRLVIPKILGLLIALPLLVVWGNIFGLLGSMLMSKSVLGLSPMVFIRRLQQAVAVKQLYLGLVKTPVFALIIAGIGCFQGFQASGSAESVGIRTTKAAVQSIFLIIVADAFFSVVFNWLDL